jgi:hypothetical protein
MVVECAEYIGMESFNPKVALQIHFIILAFIVKF